MEKKNRKMNIYQYTQTWFLNSELKQKIHHYLSPTEKHTILEIGCYEGLSSVYFADHFLNHSESTLQCVDPYMKLENNDHKELLSNKEEENFDYNMKQCKYQEKITIDKITSDEFFEKNQKTYTFIYIDGSHVCEQIYKDMTHSWNVLEKKGIMWMDDYGGGDGIQIKQTMEKWLEENIGQYEIIHIGYQLAIQKH
jgi:predicted O-methyltransferase YrrM